MSDKLVLTFKESGQQTTEITSFTLAVRGQPTLVMGTNQLSGMPLSYNANPVGGSDNVNLVVQGEFGPASHKRKIFYARPRDGINPEKFFDDDYNVENPNLSTIDESEKVVIGFNYDPDTSQYTTKIMLLFFSEESLYDKFPGQGWYAKKLGVYKKEGINGSYEKYAEFYYGITNVKENTLPALYLTEGWILDADTMASLVFPYPFDKPVLVPFSTLPAASAYNGVSIGGNDRFTIRYDVPDNENYDGVSSVALYWDSDDPVSMTRIPNSSVWEATISTAPKFITWDTETPPGSSVNAHQCYAVASTAEEATCQSDTSCFSPFASFYSGTYDGGTHNIASAPDIVRCGSDDATSHVLTDWLEYDSENSSYVSFTGVRNVSDSGTYLVECSSTSGILFYGSGEVTITAKQLSGSISNISFVSKSYDGQPLSLTYTTSFSGAVGTDGISASCNPTFVPARSKNVGTYQASFSWSLIYASGTDPNNYTGAPTTPDPVSATISQKQLTVTGSTAANKMYDGTTTASVSVGTVSGVVSGENVDVGVASATFANAGPGNNIPVAIVYGFNTAVGSDYLNYLAPVTENTTANILSSQPPVVDIDDYCFVIYRGLGEDVVQINTNELAIVNRAHVLDPSPTPTLKDYFCLPKDFDCPYHIRIYQLGEDGKPSVLLNSDTYTMTWTNYVRTLIPPTPYASYTPSQIGTYDLKVTIAGQQVRQLYDGTTIVSLDTKGKELNFMIYAGVISWIAVGYGDFESQQ